MSKKKESSQVTIRDVAKRSGVSISTVSNALNKSRYVKKETLQKIKNAAEALGYKPNVIARSLRIKSTHSVGVIIPDIANPFFAEMVKGMEEVARNLGFTLILCCTYYDSDEERIQLDLLKNKWVDGFIFASGFNTDDHIVELVDQKIPVVAVDREITKFEVPSILIDNVEAIKKSVNYLCGLGHRRIGYITFSTKNIRTVENRFMGYKEGLKEKGIDFDEDLLIIDESLRMNEIKGAYNAIEKMFKIEHPPTAIITMADVMAIGALKALKDMGFKVPQDVSLIGFDNIAYTAFTDPPLTTIKQPKKRMGSIAMTLLIDLIKKKKVGEKHIIVPTELIIRESAGRCLR
ncbi:MAG: LacI family transcriptional regulator [Actinobacteria bacterium]|nr:LacI family transcriptional regulator [Actinomycetota bacterium]